MLVASRLDYKSYPKTMLFTFLSLPSTQFWRSLQFIVHRPHVVAEAPVSEEVRRGALVTYTMAPLPVTKVMDPAEPLLAF